MVQGEKDKYGEPELVKKELDSYGLIDVDFEVVKNADHSYRDFDTKEPAYEDEAISYLR